MLPVTWRAVKAQDLSTPPGYTWSRPAARYRDAATGRFVSYVGVYRLLDANEDANIRLIRSLTGYLRDGELPLPAWYIAVQNQLRRLHVQCAALGAGGFDNLRPGDFIRIDRKLREEMDRLINFGEQVRAGLLSDAQIDNRLTMYAGTARIQFYKSQRKPATKPGEMVIERRRLMPADHCEWCLYLVDLGWQPYGVLPPPGETLPDWTEDSCLSNCRCRMEQKVIRSEDREQWIDSRRVPLWLAQAKSFFALQHSYRNIAAGKAWNAEAHPRHPAGVPVDLESGAGGGRFAPKSGESSPQAPPPPEFAAIWRQADGDDPAYRRFLAGDMDGQQKQKLLLRVNERVIQQDLATADEAVSSVMRELVSGSDRMRAGYEREGAQYAAWLQGFVLRRHNNHKQAKEQRAIIEGGGFLPQEVTWDRGIAVNDMMKRATVLMESGERAIGIQIDDPTEVYLDDALAGRTDVDRSHVYQFASRDEVLQWRGIVAGRVAEQAGIKPEQTDRMIKEWHLQGGVDTSVLAPMIQEAAAEMFGGELSDWQKEKGLNSQAYRDYANDLAGGDGEEAKRVTKAALGAMYSETQAWFKSKGITHVRLYRGVSMAGIDNLTPGAVVSFDDSALSSWSCQWSIAARFLELGSQTEGKAGAMLGAVVPVERIASIPFTGLGSVAEYEFIVIGSKKPAYATLLFNEKWKADGGATS